MISRITGSVFSNGNEARAQRLRRRLASRRGEGLVEIAQQLRSSALLEQNRMRFVGITSSSHGEGVTSVAAGVACLLAELCPGEVLLVDGNRRSPAIGRLFGMRGAAGFTDAISGRQPLEECVHAGPYPGLFIMPAGRARPTPAAVSAHEGPTIEAIESRYEQVIYDLPPVSEIAHWIIPEPLLDAVLLVVEAERVSKLVVEQSTSQLRRAGVTVLGAVLNKQHRRIPNWLYRRL